ncbi:MAG: radical SAM protein [Candidatus Microthrix parvicella]
MSKRYWLETLGCPKNQVDSDKLEGTLLAAGYEAAPGPGEAELVVVNTCAFIEDARAESVEAVLGRAEDRAEGAELVVTGCLAERAGAELAEAIPEIDRVAPFGMDLLGRFGAVDTGAPGPPETSGSVTDTVSVTLGPSRLGGSSSGVVVPDMDLLELPRPPSTSPWAYVKIAEGCDRACGFCAIPSFRGPQRSRTIESILAEVDVLARSNRSSGREGGGEDATLRAREIVLVAQDLAAYGRDQGIGQRDIIPLLTAVSQRVDWVRLLYLYPSDLTEALIDAILSTGVPYFDLSLQHTSRPVLRRMKRWGDGEQFLERIARIRELEPDAVFRSNFLIGYPGETEEDHDDLLAFMEAAQVDWCGLFTFSREAGTYAASLPDQVAPELMAERHAEASELAETITAERRLDRVGRTIEVLVDAPGVARSTGEAPEIDGIIAVPEDLTVGSLLEVLVVDAEGPDLEAVPVSDHTGG